MRMVCLRGTIHLLTADDALMIRSWTTPAQDRERMAAQNLREVRDLDLDAFSGRGVARPGRWPAVGEGAG